uniref:Secreted protein n=1 Tax=Ditylenchus dipsaci TaxID=166011 RepID=A0A915EA51_9BILA
MGALRFIAFLGSLCYIELGTSIREAGCDFAYICYVKWYSIAFSFIHNLRDLWSILIGRPSSVVRHPGGLAALCTEAVWNHAVMVNHLDELLRSRQIRCQVPDNSHSG